MVNWSCTRLAAFTLYWNSFASHDFVDDVIVLTITRGTAMVLREVPPPTVTSRAFPANFFQAEQAYTIEISFVKVVEKNFRQYCRFDRANGIRF